MLATGVGIAATAAWCGRRLAETPYDFVLNLGVCGSFDPALGPGTVVHVTTDRMPELGAEDGDAFLSVQELGLLAADEPPYRRGALVNDRPPSLASVRALPEVSGITVNTVHGRTASIERVLERWSPQVESMEGAAFMYACLIHGVRFAQIRAVSNMVERRNRAAWRMDNAVRALAEVTRRIIDEA